MLENVESTGVVKATIFVLFGSRLLFKIPLIYLLHAFIFLLITEGTMKDPSLYELIQQTMLKNALSFYAIKWTVV